MGPVIHEASFKKLASVIDQANEDPKLQLLTGGRYDSSAGYFIYPTIYAADDLTHELFSRELFGPIMVIYIYDDTEVDLQTICQKIDQTSDYALTGSIFARDRGAISCAQKALRNSAGNFYINCKSTGAVVAQQPFGGARASGTNDKAGSMALLNRFVSMRSIKEDFVGSYDVLYPSNEV